MKSATKEDADLFLKLMQVTNDERMNESMKWFEKFPKMNYKEFKSKYPPGSEGMEHFNRIMSSLELAGVLVSQGLLNENLYFDFSAVGFMWEKVGKIVPEMQKEMDPSLWENAVWLAERQMEWKKEVWKPNLKWKQQPRKSVKTRSKK